MIDDGQATRLTEALAEVQTLVLRAVVVDCSDAYAITGAGLDFLREAGQCWRLRLVEPPAGLRKALLDQAS